MEIFIAAIVIFALAFLSMAIGMLRGKRCLNCSCDAAKRIMNEQGATHCIDLVDDHCSPRRNWPPEFVDLDDHTS